jgi:hypothetical protein
MSAKDLPKYNKWTTQGMSEREMKSRIQSHQAMAYKAAERAHANTLHDAFFGKGFENYLRDNPQSPWVDKRMDFETKKVGAIRKYKQHTNVALAIGYQYQNMKRNKKRNQIAKLYGMGG